MGIVLTWEQCVAIMPLLPAEKSAIGDRMPAPEFVEFIIEPYLYEVPLREQPGIKDFIKDDIAAAQRRHSYDLSALLKIGIYQRLIAQGYAEKLPPLF
jgi:hypothetical protein